MRLIETLRRHFGPHRPQWGSFIPDIMIGLLGGVLALSGLLMFGLTHPAFTARYLDILEIAMAVPGVALVAWSLFDLARPTE